MDEQSQKTNGFEKPPPSPAWNKRSPGEEDGENKGPPPKIRETVKSFCAETTAHGIGNVVKDDALLWTKIVWLVIVLTVFGGVIFHLVYVVDTYTQYQSQETTHLLNEDPKFPYVTICNAQAWSFNHSAEYAADSSTDYYQYLELIADMETDLLDYEASTGTAIDDILLSPNGLFANLDASTIVGLGHTLTDFVLECSYLVEDCDMANDWEQVLESDFFNCYTYTGGAKSGKSASGPNNGLSLVLYMENVVGSFATHNLTYNIYSNIQNSFGVRLDIHDAKTLPTPSDTGIDIMPGHSTSIALKENKIKKLPKPWGNCTDQKNLDDLKAYDYSTVACFAVCRTKYVYDQCGCMNFYSPPPDSVPSDYKLCLFMDNVTATLQDLDANTQCAYDAHRKFVTSSKVREKCKCEEPCLYRTYESSISENIWPASIYHLDAFFEFVLEHDSSTELLAYDQLYDIYTDAHDGVEDGSLFQELIYANFARINIYFESQTILQRKQTASMTLGDLFANVGGTIGLWAGLSVVTVIEVISLIVKLVGILVQKCKKAKQSKVDDTANDQL